jgi:hypothetical protein
LVPELGGIHRADPTSFLALLDEVLATR